MTAGGRGLTVGALVTTVTVFDQAALEVRCLPAQALAFGYRASPLQHRPWAACRPRWCCRPMRRASFRREWPTSS